MASALGLRACAQGKRVAYFSMQKLLLRTKMARLDGSIHKLLIKLSKVELLIMDDFGLVNLDQQQRIDLMDIIEDSIPNVQRSLQANYLCQLAYCDWG